MIGKTQAARQPSIDELLASIRQAIHERVAPDAGTERSPAQGGPAGQPRLVHTTPTPPDLGLKAAATAPDEQRSGIQASVERPASGDVRKSLERDASRPVRHESGGPEELPASSGAPPVRERARPGSPDESAAGGRRTAASGRDGFAGLMGGDVRLEEALARLNQVGQAGQTGDSRRNADAPATAGVARPAETDSEAAAAPRLRPTIDDLGGSASPVVPPTSQTTFQGALATAYADRQRSEAKPGSAPPRQDGGAADAARPDCSPTRPREASPIGDKTSAAPRRAERPDHGSAGGGPDRLLSSEAASTAHSAFSRLADAVRSRASTSRPTARESKLDEMTRECLRPLLKGWLDENLPSLVERLVREEIERVARPGR